MTDSDQSNKKKGTLAFTKYIVMGITIGIAVILLCYGLVWYFQNHNMVSYSLLSVSFISIIILFSSLIIFYRISGDMDSKVIRRSIAVTFTVAYFLILPIADHITVADKKMSDILFSRFDYIILTIVAFYFGGRSAEKISEILKK